VSRPASPWVAAAAWLLIGPGCGRLGYDGQSGRDGSMPVQPDGADPVLPDGAVLPDAVIPAPPDGAPDIDAAPPTETLIVEPTYPLHAAWNDYVARTDPAADASHQPDVGCSALDPIDGVLCIHAGERRRVETARPSCAGLTLEDDLGSLQWRCDDRSGRAVFYSHALAPGRGLGDLVTGAAWRAMRVTLSEGGIPVETSATATWWTNRIVPLPAGGGALTGGSATGGDVFVAASDQTVRGIVIGADRIALVALPGASIVFDPAAPAGCASTATGAIDAHCIVHAQGRSFLWIEGAFRGSRTLTDLRGILLRQTRSSCLRRVHVESTGASAIELESFHESRIEDVEQESAGGSGLILSVGAAHNRIARVRLADADGEAFRLRGTYGERDAALTGAYNFVHDLYVTNSGSRAALTVDCGSHDNVFTRVVVSSSQSRGIYSVCNYDTTFSHVTATANGGPGIDIDQVDRAVVVQAIGAGNSTAGVRLDSSDTVFSRALIVGQNGTANCVVEGRTLPGLIGGTCTVSGGDGSSDYGTEMSTAVLRTGRSLVGSFLGRITSDDAVNGSDVAGAATAPTDWTRFESRDRAWGLDGPRLGDAASRGRCVGAAGCRIWDWRLAATDSAIFGRSGDGATVSLPTAGAPCPTWVRGDVALTDYVRAEILGDGVGNDDGSCQSGDVCHEPNTFLVNALELVGDDLGDEDGLCESDEICVASPHFGAWQGDGEPRGACTFDPGPGPITGVTMLVR
jgi:hypothetical protein